MDLQPEVAPSSWLTSRAGSILTHALELVDQEHVPSQPRGQVSHLIHIICFNDVVKYAVQVIQQLYNLQGGAERTQFSESNNVGEKDCHRLKMFWFHGLSSYELFSNEAETENRDWV